MLEKFFSPWEKKVFTREKNLSKKYKYCYAVLLHKPLNNCGGPILSQNSKSMVFFGSKDTKYNMYNINHLSENLSAKKKESGRLPREQKKDFDILS